MIEKHKTTNRAKQLVAEGQKLIIEGQKKHAKASKIFLKKCKGLRLSWALQKSGEKKPYEVAERMLKKEAAYLFKKGRKAEAKKFLAEAEKMRIYSENKNEEALNIF